MKYTVIVMLLLLVFIIDDAAAQQPRLAIHSYATRADNTAAKKGKYTMDEFIGRWQETARMKSGTKERTAVVDTFYIRFYKDNTADTREGNSLVITGTSEIFTDDYVTTSATDFKIVSVSPDVIVLDDMMGYQHVLSRTNRFAYETSSAPPAVEPDIADNKVDLSASSLVKNWFAYRRSARPGSVKAGVPLLRNLRIQEKLSENSYKGEVEFARDGEAYIQPCSLVFTGKMLLIDTEGSSWNIRVYKADGNEMILGKKGELVYYFKHLDQ
jgi:hypothetical protein